MSAEAEVIGVGLRAAVSAGTPRYELLRQAELSDELFRLLRREKLPAPPGEGFLSPTIEAASDDQLIEHEAKLAALVEVIAERSGLEFSRRPPAIAPWDRAVNLAAVPGDGRVLLRHVAVLRAIDRELAERERAARERARLDAEDARRRLARIVEQAPERRAEIVALAERAAEAAAVALPVLRAIETLGALVPDFANRVRDHERAVQLAGELLGVETPALPPIPELPDLAEAQRLVRAVVYGPGRDGFRELKPSRSDETKVGVFAERMRKQQQ